MRVKSFYQYLRIFCPVLWTPDYIIGERLRECETAAVKLSPKPDLVKRSSLFPVGLLHFSFQPHSIAFGGPWVTWGASLVAQTVWICLQHGRPGFDTWVGKIPWRRARQPTALFLPGESPWPESLVGYSPWSSKELDMTESPGSPRRQRATSPSAWEAGVRRERVWHGGQRMEGPEERPRGFKGMEGNIEGGEWGRMSGSTGKREVSEKQDWADPQFPTEVPISISKVMPARKQVELSRTYSHMSSRRGFQPTEKLPSEKQNQKEKTEASKEPRGKNSQPRTQGLNPHLTKRARKKFSSPGSQKVNFNLKQRTKPRTQGVNDSHSKQRARKKALQPNVYWSLSHARLCEPWTVAHQAPLFMGFPRQEYWSGLPFPSLGESSQPRVEPGSPILLLSTLCRLMCTSLWNVPLVSLIFLKRPLVFLILLFPSTFLHCSHRKAFFLISPFYSLELCIQMGIYILFSFSF